jgi:glycosyltransferase involved in cell wall biosynthesis
VSVILPAYNYERYLAQAIDSVLAQSYPAFELIVVDDGSTDGTPDVIASYGDSIQALRQRNAGVNAAVSAGMDRAGGTYLTTIGADDFWPEGRLERLAGALNDDPELGLVWGDMAVADADGTIKVPSVWAAGVIPLHEDRILGRLLERNFIAGGSQMVRASLRDRFHPIPAHGGYEDWWVAWQVATVAPIRPVHAIVNYYRLHGENMNFNATGDRVLKLMEVELPFRRWALRTVEFDKVTPDDMMKALRYHDALAQRYVEYDLPAARKLLAPDVTAARAAMHAASEALDVADVVTAHGWLVRAAVLDVTDVSPRQLLEELGPLVAGTPAAVA